MDAEGEKAQLTTVLSKVRGEPAKMKKQADIAATASANGQSQADKNDDDIRSFDNALIEQAREPVPVLHVPVSVIAVWTFKGWLTHAAPLLVLECTVEAPQGA